MSKENGRKETGKKSLKNTKTIQKKKQEAEAIKEQKLIALSEIEAFEKSTTALYEEYGVKKVKEFSPMAVGIITRELRNIEVVDDIDFMEHLGKKIVGIFNKYFTPTLDLDDYSSFMTATDILSITVNTIVAKAELNKKK
jgi:hypothetical protein